MGSQLGDVTSPLVLEDGTHLAVKEFVFQYFWYRESFLGEVIAILAGFVLVFALGIAFALRSAKLPASLNGSERGVGPDSGVVAILMTLG